VGSWHIISLNSEISTAAGSAQEAWLKADLAASGQRCTLAYWHKPLFSSGLHGNNSSVKPCGTYCTSPGPRSCWLDMITTTNGSRPRLPAVLPTPPAGFGNCGGTGGKELRDISSTKPNSQVRNADTFSVLQLTLHPDGYAWKFLPEAGKTFTDSGTDSCH
jgi:acid phosphatase type 7